MPVTERFKSSEPVYLEKEILKQIVGLNRQPEEREQRADNEKHFDDLRRVIGG